MQNGSTPLHRAAFKNSKETSKMLIEYGAEVNARDDVEMTLLFQHSLKPP